MVTLCDLTLTFTFFSTIFVLTQYPSPIFNNTLCEFELCGKRIDPRAQNEKTVFFTFDLTLTWCYLGLEVWSVGKVRRCGTKKGFERHIAPLSSTLSFQDNLGGGRPPAPTIPQSMVFGWYPINGGLKPYLFIELPCEIDHLYTLYLGEKAEVCFLD